MMRCQGETAISVPFIPLEGGKSAMQDPVLSCHPYPFRMRCRFDGKDGHVVADQLREVDRDRLIQRVGILPDDTLVEVLSILQAMFAV